MSGRFERLVLGLMVLAVAITVVRQIGVAAAFEYDESVYAVQARAWVSGTPSTGVALHRAPLLPLLGMPVAAATRTETPFRLLGLSLVLLSIVAVWWLGRTVGSPQAGLVAAGIFATSQHLMLRAGQFLTDVPAAGAMLAAMSLLWIEFERRERPGGGLVLVGPLLAAAFYLRYGSALPVALIVFTGTWLWWSTIKANGRVVVRAIGVFVVLLVPHMVTAVIQSGAPWGLVTYTSRVAAQTTIGEGLNAYVRWLPGTLAGKPAGAAMLVGLAAMILAVAARARKDARALAFLVVPALAHTILLGIFIHPEPRFMFFSVALLVVAGSIGSLRLLSPLPRRISIGVAVAMALLAVLPLPGQVRLAYARTEHLRDERAVVFAAARAIDAAVPDGEPCAALSMHVPAITWYAGCETFSFGEPERAERERLLNGVHRFIVLFHGDFVAPSPRLAARYRGIRGLVLVDAVDHPALMGKVRITGYEIYRMPRGLPE